MTQYKCIVSTHNGLTLNKIYIEQNINPNPFNACLINDDGEKTYVEKIYLEELSNERN